jgi:hypothetical protein
MTVKPHPPALRRPEQGAVLTTFLFSYRVAKDATPADADAHAAWRAWFGEINDHVADLGNPIFERTVIGAPVDQTVLGGYSLIDATDLDQAVALAQGCPLLALGGGVEVGVVTRLSADDLMTTVADHATATSIA